MVSEKCICHQCMFNRIMIINSDTVMELMKQLGNGNPAFSMEEMTRVLSECVDGAVQKALAKHKLINPPTIEEEAPKRKKTLCDRKNTLQSKKRHGEPQFVCSDCRISGSKKIISLSQTFNIALILTYNIIY